VVHVLLREKEPLVDFSGMFLGELMDGLVNFYRHSNDQKVAIKSKIGDNSV